jgi:hypothetical protein
MDLPWGHDAWKPTAGVFDFLGPWDKPSKKVPMLECRAKDSLTRIRSSRSSIRSYQSMLERFELTHTTQGFVLIEAKYCYNLDIPNSLLVISKERW